MKSIRTILLLFFALSLQLVYSQSTTNLSVNKGTKPSGLLYQWTFDELNPFHDLAEKTSNVSITTDPLNPSNKVMMCYLPTGEYRSEVSVGDPKIHYFFADSVDNEHGDEIWVGVKILKMKEVYTATNKNPCIFQIGPLKNEITFPGKISSGHFQLQLNTETDKWKWREFKSDYNFNFCKEDISEVNYGKWDKFVFHCKFKSNAQGLMEVWQNGTKIYSITRQNGIRFSRTRIKWGVYIGAGNTEHEPLHCYYDDVKIGGRNSSYQEVEPK